MIRFILILVGVACLVQGTIGKQCTVGVKQCKSTFCVPEEGSKQSFKAVCQEFKEEGESGKACTCKNKDVDFSEIDAEKCEMVNDDHKCKLICGAAVNIYGYLCPKSGKERYCYCGINNIMRGQ